VHFGSLFHDFGELTVTGLAQGAIYALFALATPWSTAFSASSTLPTPRSSWSALSPL